MRALDVLGKRTDNREATLISEAGDQLIGDLVSSPLVGVGCFDVQMDEDLAGHVRPFVEVTADSAKPAPAVKVAALFVAKGGVYYGLEGVDPWDEDRDARLYDGPWPVVAHPPCARWSIMGACRGYRDGEDGGCFQAALRAVRTFGGVLEHPRYSLAWERFSLPAPSFDGWATAIGDPGWATEIDQHAYGLRFRKPTWLYFVGAEPPAMIWQRAGRASSVASNGRDRLSIHNHHGWGNGQRATTPPELRDVLIAMARSAHKVSVAT